MRYLCANIGNLISAKKISDYLTSSGRKTTSDTIESYLKLLENAFILYHAFRYDLKGKIQLKTQGKYYIADMGIRSELLGFRNEDYSFVLENIVYFELLRRGFNVFVGKLGALETDFVAVKSDKIQYVQVTASMLSESVRDRELKALRAIDDNYEKIVLSMDKTPITDFKGIKNINIIDFLMSES